MTNNDSDFETIAAFIDSERVDPLALKRALASEEGRNYLVQLVAMREVMATPPLTCLGSSDHPIIGEQRSGRLLTPVL